MIPGNINPNSVSISDPEKHYEIKLSLNSPNPNKILEDFSRNLIKPEIEQKNKISMTISDPKFKLARDILLEKLELGDLPGFNSLSWITYSKRVYEKESNYKNTSKDVAVIFKDYIVDLNLRDRILKGNVYFIGDFNAMENSINVINQGRKTIPYSNVFFDWFAFCPDPHKEKISKENSLYDENEKFYLGLDSTGELSQINLAWMMESFRPPRMLTDIQIRTIINNLRLNPETGNWLMSILQRFNVIKDQNIEIISKYLKDQNILSEAQINFLSTFLRTFSNDDVVVGTISRSDYISKEKIDIVKLYKLVIACFSMTNIGGSVILKLPLPNFPFLDAIYILLGTLFPVIKILKLKEDPLDNDTIYLIGTQFNLTRNGDVILNEMQMKTYVGILNGKVDIYGFLFYLYSISREAVENLHNILNNRIGKDIEIWIERLMTENGGWKLRNLGK